MELIDSHCHFDAEEFDPDRDAVYSRALAAGITAILSPATTAATWPRLQKTAQQYAGVYPAYGLHPMMSAQHQPDHLSLLEEWIVREKPHAIGECGLDFYAGREDEHKQRMLLKGQLALAAAHDLPIIIHARRAVEDVILLLRDYPTVRGVLHSYSGSLEQAKRLIDHGFYLGFGGPLTWPKSQRLRALVKQLPLNTLLLETDAPDQTGQAHRHTRNEPAYLPEIACTVAALQTLSVDDVAQQTSANAHQLFALP